MKNKIVAQPTKLKNFSFENLYIEISGDWEHRAKDLQARRWAIIKQRERKGLGHVKHSFN